MRVWLRGKWLKIRVSVIALIAFIAGVANTYAYVQYQELSGSLSENRGSTFIQINAEPVSASSDVEPVAVAEDESPQFSVQEIADKIYILESSGGKNDSCRLKGMWNGYGYFVYDKNNRCFESQAEVRVIVEKWFLDKLQEYSLPEAVCGYNLGFQSPNLEKCVAKSEEYPYYLNFSLL
jgi:hypothetical protein